MKSIYLILLLTFTCNLFSARFGNRPLTPPSSSDDEDYSETIDVELKEGGSIGQANARINLIKAANNLAKINKREEKLRNKERDQRGYGRWGEHQYQMDRHKWIKIWDNLRIDKEEAEKALSQARAQYNKERQAALDAKAARAKEAAGAGAGAGV